MQCSSRSSSTTAAGLHSSALKWGGSHFNLTRQVGLARFTPSTAPATKHRLLEQYLTEACTLTENISCNATTKTLWAKGCRGKFQCGRATVRCGGGVPPHTASCELSCEAAGTFVGNWTRLSGLNPLDVGFGPAKPGIENPVGVRSQDKSSGFSRSTSPSPARPLA